MLYYVWIPPAASPPPGPLWWVGWPAPPAKWPRSPQTESYCSNLNFSQNIQMPENTVWINHKRCPLLDCVFVYPVCWCGRGTLWRHPFPAGSPQGSQAALCRTLLLAEGTSPVSKPTHTILIDQCIHVQYTNSRCNIIHTLTSGGTRV